MVGGGQLSRMTSQAATALGMNFRVLVQSESDSASQVTNNYILGEHTNLDHLRALAQVSDVVTFDHEHVPEVLLRQLVQEGFNLQPTPDALVFAQDKVAMRKKLHQLGVAQPSFAVIETIEQAIDFGKEFTKL